jgi:hypothetical protein
MTIRVNHQCMEQAGAEPYDVRYECMSCRRVVVVTYSMGHPPIAGFHCTGCDGPATEPVCPCGGTDLTRGSR